MRASRNQARRLADWLTREQPSLRAVLLAARRQGKSDLLEQTRRLLFERAEGPLPFLYRFEELGDALSSSAQARRIAAAFCQQMRAFLLRQQDLLGEPPGELESEIARPGTPLSLAELARELLALPAERQETAGAQLAARFAHREGRPVCVFLDECQALSESSALLTGLDDSMICWLVTGHELPMRRLAGARNWTAIALDPFSLKDALILAEDCCRHSGVRFTRQAWEDWFLAAGTSPGWAVPLIESAALRDVRLENIEQLADLYLDELEEGSLGRWLEDRWPRSVEGAQVAEGLLRGQPPAFNEQQPAPLENNEWFRQRAFVAESTLGAVERDWLRLELDRAKLGRERARASVREEFLRRAAAERLTAAAAKQSGDVSSAARGIETRLDELKARAQWLQEELAAAKSQLAPHLDGAGGAATVQDRRNEYLRQLLSLSLMLASADLMASSAQSSSEAQRSLASLRLQCQQLIEELRAEDSLHPSVPESAPAPAQSRKPPPAAREK